MRDNSHHLNGIYDAVAANRPEVLAYSALQEQVRGFQNELSDNHEIGVSVAGTMTTIHVRSMVRKGHMIVFDGTDERGRQARLIQHYSQINVQMIAVDAIAEEAHRIGF